MRATQLWEVQAMEQAGWWGRILNHNLTYEARVAWGRSQNKVTPSGTYTDKFETSRWLASAKIGGMHQFGDFTIKPEASFSWFEEKQEAYTDSLTNAIPSQTISLVEVRFGPEISHKAQS